MAELEEKLRKRRLRSEGKLESPRTRENTNQFLKDLFCFPVQDWTKLKTRGSPLATASDVKQPCSTSQAWSTKSSEEAALSHEGRMASHRDDCGSLSRVADCENVEGHDDNVPVEESSLAPLDRCSQNVMCQERLCSDTSIAKDAGKDQYTNPTDQIRAFPAMQGAVVKAAVAEDTASRRLSHVCKRAKSGVSKAMAYCRPFARHPWLHWYILAPAALYLFTQSWSALFMSETLRKFGTQNDVDAAHLYEVGASNESQGLAQADSESRQHSVSDATSSFNGHEIQNEDNEGRTPSAGGDAIQSDYFFSKPGDHPPVGHAIEPEEAPILEGNVMMQEGAVSDTEASIQNQTMERHFLVNDAAKERLAMIRAGTDSVVDVAAVVDEQSGASPFHFVAVPVGSLRLMVHHPLVSITPGLAQDVSDDFQGLLEEYPSITAAIRLGRINIHSNNILNTARVTASIALGNNGATTWPATTSLDLSFGDDLGLESLPLDVEVPPGIYVNLTMQLMLPTSCAIHSIGSVWASIWLLQSANHRFGPLLILETQCV